MFLLSVLSDQSWLVFSFDFQSVIVMDIYVNSSIPCYISDTLIQLIPILEYYAVFQIL